MATGVDPDGTVEAIVADRFRVETDAFDDETAFDEAPLGADSLDMVEVAEAIEAAIGVHVPDEALAEIDTVGDLKGYVAEAR